MKPIVEIKDLSKTYGTLKALDNINVILPRGKIIGLLGPNGSGKTTLIKTLNGLVKPDSGTVLIDDNKVSVKTKEIVSYLPEVTYLDDSLKVYETFDFFSDFYENFDRVKAERLLTDLNLSLDTQIKSLSKGNKEKVQLILVMSRNAKLYILDEPIAGVDPATRDYILNTILNNLNENSTLLISTHLIRDIEEILDEIVIINEGNILYSGEKSLLLKEHSSVDEWFRKEFSHVKTS